VNQCAILLFELRTCGLQSKTLSWARADVRLMLMFLALGFAVLAAREVVIHSQRVTTAEKEFCKSCTSSRAAQRSVTIQVQ